MLWEYYLDRESAAQPLSDAGTYSTETAPFATGRYVRLLMLEQGAVGSSSLDQYYGITEWSLLGR